MTVSSVNESGRTKFMKDIKPPTLPDTLPKLKMKFMISDDVRAKETVIKKYFCRSRPNICNTIYFN